MRNYSQTLTYKPTLLKHTTNNLKAIVAYELKIEIYTYNVYNQVYSYGIFMLYIGSFT